MSENESQVKRYEVFLEGELIDLCIPSVTAINEDEWAGWFNNIEQLHQEPTRGCQITIFSPFKNRKVASAAATLSNTK